MFPMIALGFMIACADPGNSAPMDFFWVGNDGALVTSGPDPIVFLDSGITVRFIGCFSDPSGEKTLAFELKLKACSLTRKPCNLRFPVGSHFHPNRISLPFSGR